MEAAIAKHGPVTLPDYSHMEEFFNKVDSKKEDIARA
jgi:hypothetical protein